jgi:hypothetical protein
MIKYVVRLTEAERTALTEVIGKGKAAARKIKHANVLLKLDADGPGWSDAQAADAFDCSARTVIQHPTTLCRSRLGGGAGTQEARTPAA